MTTLPNFLKIIIIFIACILEKEREREETTLPVEDGDQL